MSLLTDDEIQAGGDAVSRRTMMTVPPYCNAALKDSWSSEVYYIHRSDIVAQLAYWAVVQSPYTVPDSLSEALLAFDVMLQREIGWDSTGWAELTLDLLAGIVNESTIESIPEIAEWNEPASRHGQMFVCSSRYGSPAPDDDLIDFGALARNVVYGVIRRAALERCGVI